MLCNLAYVKNVSTTDFFKVELDFQSGKMDLFHIRIRLGVSRGHSVRDKSTVLNVYIFRILKAVAVQFYRKSLLKADRLHSNRLIYPVNRERCSPQSSSAIWKIASFTVKRSFSCLHSMSRDGMSKEGPKMSSMQVTLKASVFPLFCLWTTQIKLNYVVEMIHNFWPISIRFYWNVWKQ